MFSLHQFKLFCLFLLSIICDCRCSSISWMELMNLNVLDFRVKLKLYEISINARIPANVHSSKLESLPIHQELLCDVSGEVNELESFRRFDFFLKTLRVHYISSDDLKFQLLLKQIPFSNFTIITLQSELLSVEQARKGLIELKAFQLNNQTSNEVYCYDFYLFNLNFIYDHLSLIASNISVSCVNFDSDPPVQTLQIDGMVRLETSSFIYRQYYEKTLLPFLRNLLCRIEPVELDFELQNLEYSFVDSTLHSHLDYLTITRKRLPSVLSSEYYEQAFQYFQNSCVTVTCKSWSLVSFDPFQKCHTLEKFFFSLPEQEVDATNFINRNGYLTSRYFFCCKDQEDEEVCVPSLQTLSMYHQLMLRGMLYAPSKLFEENNSSHVHKKKFFMGGLGGGELNSYLIAKFPNFQFEHVEISSTVLITALHHLGMKDFICNVYEFSLAENQPAQFSRLEKIQNYAIPTTESEIQCQSNIILADVTVYTKYLSSLIQGISDSPTTSLHPLTIQDLFYDYFFLDIYDSRAFLWDGRAFEGNSIPKEILTEPVFQSIQYILRPNSGLAIFHFHKDAYYRSLIKQIIAVFGRDQLVYLNLLDNDSVILAGRNTFTWNASKASNLRSIPVPHPCSYENVKALNSEIHRIAKELTIEIENIFLYDYAVDCEFMKEFL